jgi:hypothetical protein
MKSPLRSAAAADARVSNAPPDISGITEFQSLPAPQCPGGQYPLGEIRLTPSTPGG